MFMFNIHVLLLDLKLLFIRFTVKSVLHQFGRCQLGPYSQTIRPLFETTRLLMSGQFGLYIGRFGLSSGRFDPLEN